MRYKAKTRIKPLIVAGLLAFNLSGCKREIKQYINISQENITVKDNTENANDVKVLVDNKKIEELIKKLNEGFKTNTLILDKTSNKLISSITIDGTSVSIELCDGNIVSGTLYNLDVFNVTLKNLYIYDSKYTEDLYNIDEKYKDYKEKGYTYKFDALKDDYEIHKKLEVQLLNCSISNEYKEGVTEDVFVSVRNIDYTACKRLWLYNTYLNEEDDFSIMPNLETLILAKPQIYFLEEENISIHSNSLKNIIIDGQIGIDYIDKFDFTGCPNLEVVSITSDTQETDLEGLKGLTNLKELAFGLPTSKFYDTNALIYNDFQERIDLVSDPFPTDNEGLTRFPNCMISDISAINGSNIEVLNISFLQYISSDMLLETVKSLPHLKQIVGFEVNNAGMCCDELLQYCEEHKIKHPFTQKSLKIKHKLEEIVSDVITENMNEEQKIKALSEYIVTHMEYDWDLIDDTEKETERIIKGWGESLYYSVIEGEGICEGYTRYAQSLFSEAGIKSFKTYGVDHTWNLVQIDDEYYYVDLTNVDGLVDESISTSFDDYNLETYYLVPIEDYPFESYMLPIEVEKQFNGKENEQYQYSDKLESYIIQTDRENKKEYSKFCGIIGILCALGLAKKVMNRGKELEKCEVSKDTDGVIKVASLKKLVDILKRNKKLEELRNKRKIAEEERIKNKKAKKLEMEVNQVEKEEGENTR